MQKQTSIEAVIQNLKDAGCTEDTIQMYLQYFVSGRKEEQIKMLEQHRALLLEQVHSKEHQIDCLDDLVFFIEKT